MIDIIQGDAFNVLRGMRSDFVDLCVTSPPYWGLRDYGIEPQQWGDELVNLGAEENYLDYVSHMVDIFHEVKRVLKPSGTLYLVLGDSYSGSGKGRMGDGTHAKIHGTKQSTNVGTLLGHLPKSAGLPRKNLYGIPWWVALSLQADGWILRNDNVWHKPNPLTHGARDRFTSAHEYIFMLTKSPTYYFNTDEAMEPTVDGLSKRLPRDVWTIPVSSSKEAHYAKFPYNIPDRAIRISCPASGIVLDPFSGSGTSGVAASNNARSYIGIELNATYALSSRFKLANIQSNP